MLRRTRRVGGRRRRGRQRGAGLHSLGMESSVVGCIAAMLGMPCLNTQEIQSIRRMIVKSDISHARAMRMLNVVSEDNVLDDSIEDFWPLHWAASMGCVDLVKQLSCDINVDTNDSGFHCDAPGRSSESAVLMCMKLPVKGGTAPTEIANSERRELVGTLRPYAANRSTEGIIPLENSMLSNNKALEDPVEAMPCSESSLFRPSSEGADILNNTNCCIWTWPNWPKGDVPIMRDSCVETMTSASILRSSSSAQVAGAHEVGVNPMLYCDYLVDSDSTSVANASSDNCHDPIELDHLVQLFVKLIDYPTLSVQLDCNASVKDMVKKALIKSGVYLRDSYVKVNGRTIAPDSLIIFTFRNATFTISPRMRGGVPDIPSSISFDCPCIPLHDYLLGLGDSIFDVVRFNDRPCRSLGADYFVALGKPGRIVYYWLFTLVEKFHAMNRCPLHFTVWDIVYVHELKCLMFYRPRHEGMSTENYRRNILDVATILESYFRYSPSRLAANENGTGIHEMDRRQSLLPNHLEYLVDFIKDMPRRNAREDGLTVSWRSIFLIDPAGMSSAAKVALILSLDLKVKYLSDKEKEAFCTALGETSDDWRPFADAIPALRDILHFQFYDRDTRQYRAANYDGTSLYSLWLLGRNHLSHSDRLEMDLKAAEAMFSFVFIYLLPLVIRTLVRKYQAPVLASTVQNKLTFHEVLDME